MPWNARNTAVYGMARQIACEIAIAPFAAALVDEVSHETSKS
jgi:hypothetical protein